MVGHQCSTVGSSPGANFLSTRPVRAKIGRIWALWDARVPKNQAAFGLEPDEGDGVSLSRSPPASSDERTGVQAGIRGVIGDFVDELLRAISWHLGWRLLGESELSGGPGRADRVLTAKSPPKLRPPLILKGPSRSRRSRTRRRYCHRRALHQHRRCRSCRLRIRGLTQRPRRPTRLLSSLGCTHRTRW
jgi:hypothetical protein